MITTGQAVSFGLNVLGKLGKKKPKKATPLDFGKQALSAGGFKEARSISLSSPSTSRVAKTT